MSLSVWRRGMSGVVVSGLKTNRMCCNIRARRGFFHLLAHFTLYL